MENALDLEAWWWGQWWFGDAWWILGQGAWYKIEGRMNRNMYKCILENLSWSTIQIYNLDPSRLVFQHDNDSMDMSKIVQEWLASQPFQLLQWHAQSPNLNPIEHFWALLKHRLNKPTTPPRGIQEYGSVCVQCIPIFVNMIACRFMRTCHKELMLCWRVGVTEPITKDLVDNLIKTEYLCIVFHLALLHTLILLP